MNGLCVETLIVGGFHMRTSIRCPHAARHAAPFARRLILGLLGLVAGGDWSLLAPHAYGDAPTLLSWNYYGGGDGGPELNEPLVTDRPDFTEASSTVGQRVAQLETGYTYVFDDAEGVEAHSYPEALLRVGVFADWLELRVGWSYLAEEVGPERDSGADDLYLGAKLGLTGQEGILPEIAVVPQMRVPTGGGDFSAGETLPGVNWLYGWDVSDFIATGGSTQYNRRIDGESDEAYTEWAQSWTINYSLGENLTGYTEWFGLFPHSSESVRPENYFDGGFAYLFTDNVQGDVRAGVGLNDAAADYFVGIGLSMRFH